MKLTAILLTVAILQVQANGYSQITLSVTNVPVEKVFNEIQRQAGYDFLYTEKMIADIPRVSIDVKNASVQEVLTKCFEDQPLSFTVDGNMVVIMKKLDYHNIIQSARHIMPIPIDVEGKVVDKNGKPLAGVSVTVKGTTKGSSTSSTGAFILNNLPERAVLQITMVGFESIDVEVRRTGDNITAFAVNPSQKGAVRFTAGKVLELHITLTESEKQMEEVMISTGVVQRKSVSYTGAATTIQGDDLRRVGNQNIFQSLKNLDPTIYIMENMTMGSDPNSLPDMNMRGGTSFSDVPTDPNLKGNYQNKPNQPLFILDGFETSVERVFDLDMNTVASLTILKDASAKALYGAKAANGVVVIETKQLSGTKPRLTYTGSLDLTMPDLSSYNLTDGLEKLDVEFREGVYPDSDPTALTKYYKLRKEVLEGLNTDWISKPVQMGYGYKHGLSVDLGRDELRTNINLSYYDNRGVMKGSGRKTLNGDLTMLYKVKRLKFQNRLSLTNTKADDSPYGDFTTYTFLNPYLNPYDEFGNLLPIMTGGIRNPLNDGEIPTSLKSGYFGFVNNFEAEFTFNSSLRLRARFSIEKKNNNADRYYPATHTRFALYPNSIAYRKGQYEANYGHSDKISADLYLNYNKTINHDHNFFFAGGFNIAENKYREEIHYTEGFPSENMNDMMFALQYNSVIGRPSGISGMQRDLGFLSMLSYTFQNRFLFDGTYRLSASSVFGNENMIAPFWSIGLGWNLHKEKFLSGISSLKLLKIRGSIGSTGNQNFRNNKSLAVINYFLNDRYTGLIGSHAANMENPELKWESKMDYDMGLDADIARVNVRFDLYRSITQNLVTSISTAPSTGFANVSENLGRVENKGMEISLSYTIFQNRKGFFRVNGAYTINKNTILKISDAMRTYNDNQLKGINNRDSISKNTQTIVLYYDGLPMNTIWAVPSYGIDPATGIELLKGKNGEPTYIWKASDMVPSGISVPKWRGDFGFNGEYKGFGAGVTCTFLGGGQLYNQTLVDKIENIDIRQNFDRRVLTDRWMTPGMEVQYKRNVGATPYDMRNGLYFYSGGLWRQELTRPTQRFVQDQNELNISSVNIYYDFNRKLISRWGMERLKISAYMNDVAKFSTIGIERGTTYPFARTISFKLSATF